MMMDIRYNIILLLADLLPYSLQELVWIKSIESHDLMVLPANEVQILIREER